MDNFDWVAEEYCWIKELIKNGKAKIERNVETEVYIRGKGNSDVIKTEKRICDVITILK